LLQRRPSSTSSRPSTPVPSRARSFAPRLVQSHSAHHLRATSPPISRRHHVRAQATTAVRSCGSVRPGQQSGLPVFRICRCRQGERTKAQETAQDYRGRGRRGPEATSLALLAVWHLQDARHYGRVLQGRALGKMDRNDPLQQLRLYVGPLSALYPAYACSALIAHKLPFAL